jgi:hypothetical protein
VVDASLTGAGISKTTPGCRAFRGVRRGRSPTPSRRSASPISSIRNVETYSGGQRATARIAGVLSGPEECFSTNRPSAWILASVSAPSISSETCAEQGYGDRADTTTHLDEAERLCDRVAIVRR